MQFYPTDGEGPVAEVWDAEKLSSGECKEQLTPMVVSPHDSSKHFFVNELCELEGGKLFVPEMFFRQGDELWAHGYNVESKLAVSDIYAYS